MLSTNKENAGIFPYQGFIFLPFSNSSGSCETLRLMQVTCHTYFQRLWQNTQQSSQKPVGAVGRFYECLRVACFFTILTNFPQKTAQFIIFYRGITVKCKLLSVETACAQRQYLLYGC